MLRIDAGSVLRALEVERQPLLYALEARSLRQVGEKHQVKYQWRGQDGVTAQEVDLDLHRIAEPAEDVDVVPAFFAVTPRRVVVDTHLVVDVAIEVGIKPRLQDVLQYAELGLLLGAEAVGVI